jgi:hypothetical protein
VCSNRVCSVPKDSTPLEDCIVAEMPPDIRNQFRVQLGLPSTRVGGRARI